MKIETFGVERWMDLHEKEAVNNVAETCVDSLTVRELLGLAGEPEKIIEDIMNMRLTYGEIEGSPRLRGQIAELYDSMRAENVLVMNGGSASNFLVLYTLVEPGDHIISVNPSYQQLRSIPESFGAEVELLHLAPEDHFLPDLDRLSKMLRAKTKVICINNPNNPTGSLMNKEMLEEIAGIAASMDAWVLCDEVYRMLVHEEGTSIASMADIYEKGISVGSMSKAFSLAGLRLGWLTGSRQFIDEAMIRRDYTNISCGMIDDYLAAVALENRGKILDRNLGIIRSNVEILDHWVNGEERVSYIKPVAGTTAFLHYDYDITSRDFCSRLIDMDGTFLVPGECFGMEKWLRIGYAFDPRVLEKGLDGMSRLLRTLEKEGL
jgi:aspartate/methionine/tyrosine aminotransferase